MSKVKYLLLRLSNIFASFIFSIIARYKLQLVRANSIGEYFRVSGPVDIHLDPTSIVKIGNNCRINSGFINNAVGGYRRTGIWVGKNAELNIGENVGISNSTIVSLCSVSIADNVYIGGDTNIYDTDFHPTDAKERSDHISGKKSRVLICRDSFIGGHVIILKGVEIGEGAIIGAGSVVTKNIPPYEIWAGNPARFIRKLK
jgi:acetyltransferase-like isoleucine patch superfamily enzyme